MHHFIQWGWKFNVFDVKFQTVNAKVLIGLKCFLEEMNFRRICGVHFFCVLGTLSWMKQGKHPLTDRLHLSWPALFPPQNIDLAFSRILASQTLCKPSLFAWRHAKTRSVRAGVGGGGGGGINQRREHLPTWADTSDLFKRFVGGRRLAVFSIQVL